ncbi:MAG TPA: 23S rRNA (uracil(1939)-C(5))-methyltransferase RlmD [Ignavibacteria bacterium]
MKHKFNVRGASSEDKPSKDEILELVIEDIGFEGSGIGKTGGNFAVFVPNTVPGDRIQARVYKTKKNLAEARLVKLLEASSYRTEAKCNYFGTCNGCKMQHINYNHQLEIKRNNVINAFTRIGGFKNIEVPSVIGSDNQYFYRNKLEFSFSSNRWLTEEDIMKDNNDKSFALGFHKPGFIDKVIDINECLLQSDLSNQILNFTRDFFKSRNISIYSTKTHEGFLRFLIIRQSANKNDLLINIITSQEDEDLMEQYSNYLLNNINTSGFDITIIHSISSAKAQVAQAEKFKFLHGKGYIEETIGKIQFKISPFSFFQTNSKQCEQLFETIIKIGDFQKDENILDLYCGCGAISLYISDRVSSVYGVELSSDAIESAKENSKINNITNCRFEAYDVKVFLHSPIPTKAEIQAYTTFILDPPRSGIHPKDAEYILQLAPKKIIYVSCNPTTQARDIRLLSEKYNITGMQPVDMFPHTFHIENVVRLDLK